MANAVETEDIEEEELELDQHLVFSLKSQEFGIQAARVQEISRVLPTTEVPNAPPYVDGVMNLRGRLSSVVNLRKRLGFEAVEHDEDTRVVVVELGGFPIGVIVDSVQEVIKIPAEKVQRLPESTSDSESGDYLTGVGMLDNRLVIMLDVDKVLAGTEMVELGDIKQVAERAREAQKTVAANEMTHEREEAVQPAEGKEAGAGPAANTAKRRRRRTG